MFSFECAMAIALLTAPQGPAELPVRAGQYRCLAPALQKVAVMWELLDRRETQHVLARAEDFEADLKLLRNRYHKLLSAPRVWECRRFPDRIAVNDLLTANRTYRQYLTARQPVDLVHADDVRTVVNETDRLYEIWDAVRDAGCTYYYVTVRRQALQHLRELIGMEAFYRAELPPHLPVWRIPEID
jgi:hypothetical protein